MINYTFVLNLVLVKHVMLLLFSFLVTRECGFVSLPYFTASFVTCMSYDVSIDKEGIRSNRSYAHTLLTEDSVYFTPNEGTGDTKLQ